MVKDINVSNVRARISRAPQSLVGVFLKQAKNCYRPTMGQVRLNDFPTHARYQL
jgi:hypothetical protein